MLVLTNLHTAKKSNWNHLLSIKESFLFILFVYFIYLFPVSCGSMKDRKQQNTSQEVGEWRRTWLITNIWMFTYAFKSTYDYLRINKSMKYEKYERMYARSVAWLHGQKWYWEWERGLMGKGSQTNHFKKLH